MAIGEAPSQQPKQWLEPLRLASAATAGGMPQPDRTDEHDCSGWPARFRKTAACATRALWVAISSPCGELHAPDQALRVRRLAFPTAHCLPDAKTFLMIAAVPLYLRDRPPAFVRHQAVEYIAAGRRQTLPPRRQAAAPGPVSELAARHFQKAS